MRLNVIIVLCIVLCPELKAQSLSQLSHKADSLKNVYGEEDERYLHLLSEMVPVAFHEGEVQKAFNLRLEHSIIIGRKKGFSSFEYADDLNRLGNLSKDLGHVDVSLKYYEQSLDIINSLVNLTDEHTNDYWLLLFSVNLSVADICFQQKDIDRAISHYDSALCISQQHEVGEAILPISRLSSCYSWVGFYSEAVKYGRQALSLFEERGWSNSTAKEYSDYIKMKVYLAWYHDKSGQSSKALAEYLEIKNEYDQFANYSVEDYLFVCSQIVQFYSLFGDVNRAYELSKDVYHKALELCEEDNYFRSLCVMIYATELSIIGQYEEAEGLLLSERQKALLNADSWGWSLYVELVKRLISLYCNTNEMEKANNTILSLFSEMDFYFGQISLSEIQGLAYMMAQCLIRNGQFSEARECLDTIIEPYRIMGLDMEEASEDVFLWYSLIAKISILENSSEEEYILPIVDSYKQRVMDLMYYPEEEKLSIVDGYTIKDLVFTLRHSEKYDGQLYDFLLLQKGLLLQSNLNMQSYIESDAGADLVELYCEIKTLKRRLKEALVKQEKNDYLEIRQITITRERELNEIIRYRDTSDLNWISNVGWERIASALKDNEVAIEFVNYYNYLEKEDLLVAMVLRRGWSCPKYVQLCELSSINKLIKNKPDILYGDGYVAQLLIESIWEPLEIYLNKGDTIFFSPSGILYGLNLSAFPHQSGNTLGEVYQLVRCSSTRCVVTSIENRSICSAAIWGGLEYDVPGDEVAMGERSKVSKNSSPSIHFIDSYSRGEKEWTYLSGTLVESNLVTKMLLSKNVDVTLYQNKEGKEESFKSLSGQSPTIIHLATHGFYYPKEKASSNEYSIIHFNNLDLNTNERINSIDDAMIRCGLIMSGGNKAYRGELRYDDIEDGVLTALEISNMNLSQTDLVVLSACKTGLGDLSDEGVLGLQRAFKNAGVSSILMSLWDVNDDATLLLMESFYKHLLKGESKRDAFKAGVSTLRHFKGDRIIDGVKKRVDYSSPFYWAAFIMLD